MEEWRLAFTPASEGAPRLRQGACALSAADVQEVDRRRILTEPGLDSPSCSAPRLVGKINKTTGLTSESADEFVLENFHNSSLSILVLFIS